MASMFYVKALDAFLKGQISVLSDTIKIAFVDTGVYTPDMEEDEFLSDLPNNTIVGTPVALSNKNVSAGALTANDPLFVGLTGTSVEKLLVYKDTGTPSTSRLISLHDATGMPFTPSGADVLVQLPSSVVFGLSNGS